MQNTLYHPQKEHKLFLNPMIRKISEVRESSENVSTYGGIYTKFLYFLLMIVVGIAVTVVLNVTNVMGVDPVTHEVFGSRYVVMGILASVVMFFLFPILAFVIKRTIPVLGALYCVGTGYLLGCVMMLDAEIRAYMLLAMALTFSIVAMMGMLYFKGYIRIGNKFRAITYTSFSTLVLSSFLLGICHFIPSLKEGVMILRNNPLLSIGASISGVIIATLFLLIDFETIRETVEGRLPKKYEWFAAFGLMFTVIWLYLKILDLLFKIRDGHN